MDEFPRYDDVGSFPLPNYIDKKAFDEFYWITYNTILKNLDIYEHRGIQNYFIHPLMQSFNFKLKAGVEVINYPQHMDMMTQFLKPIADHESEPELIDPKAAIIPEIVIIEDFAKEHYEKTGQVLKIKICVTGPIECYIKKHGFTVYKDMALNFSRSINSFLKNSIINTKYMKVPLISIDEPSFGYVDIVNVSDDDLIEIFDKSVEHINTDNEIHLHSLNRADIPLRSNGINILTCEYAADRNNKIPKRVLEQHDKFIRTGISRTNINRIMADALDSGTALHELKTIEGSLKLVDSMERIKKRLLEALGLYGDRLKYVGPDCGFTGWTRPEAAYELLRRTHEVIEQVKKEK